MAMYMQSPDRKKAASLIAGWVTVKGGGGTVSPTADTPNPPGFGALAPPWPTQRWPAARRSVPGLAAGASGRKKPGALGALAPKTLAPGHFRVHPKCAVELQAVTVLQNLLRSATAAPNS